MISDNPNWETVPLLYGTDVIGEVRWMGVLVIDEGRIVERGTHTGLLQLGGRYAELYAAGTTLASA